MIKISPIPNYDCEVLIIGAGPGGSALAGRLAQNGICTILIESQEFPRDKVCGDFVGPVAIAELQKLGIAGLEDFPKANRINEASVFLDGEEIINQAIPRLEGIPYYGRVIPRITLDHWIFEYAQKKGAITKEKTRLKNYTVYPDKVVAEISQNGKSKTIIAKMIIGADGSSSTVARIFHGQKPSDFDRILAVRAYYEGIEGPQDRCDLFFTEESFPGYYWLFPTGNGNANIGVGMVLKTLPQNDTHLKELLTALIQKDKSLSARVGNGQIKGKIQGWPLATYNAKKKIIGNRLLLLGDAAGLINSLNGEGIQYALLSARWAADTIISSVQNDDFSTVSLTSYKKKIEEELAYDLTLSNMIIQCIRNRKLNPFWMELLSIMVSRARIDKSYAEIAGGILAGMQPANKAVHPAFITKTLVQGAMHFGVKGAKEVLKGPEHWMSTGKSTVAHVKEIIKEAKENPKEYKEWLQGLTTNGIKISDHIWKDIKKQYINTK
ncbi:geranylgeranyl reductase family protein [Aquimarina rhabdastrellae]